jgi:phosphatidylglycerol---prolipoprotein diacylglyceryl transferase
MLGYIQYPPWIHPEIIPGLFFRWYGLMYLVAFVVTYLLLTWQLKQREVKPPQDLVLDMFFWGIIGLIVGGRLFYVVVYDPGYFIAHPLRIILPPYSGMSYHGGVLGAVIALAIFMRRRKLSILEWGDMLVAGIPLGYTFGRLGNFINGELYGRITKVPWAMVFPNAEGFPSNQPWVRDFAAAVGMPVNGPLVNLPRHPSQLYEAFFEGFVLWLILWFIVRKRKPYNGFVIAWYMIGYGVFRFFIEYARQPDRQIGFPIVLVHLGNPGEFSWFNFTMGQILNVVLIAAAVIALFAFRARARSQRAPLDAGPRPSARKLRKKLK